MTKKKKNKELPININSKTPIYALDFQTSFQCSNCGLCCASNLGIQVEQDIYDTLCRCIKNRELQLPSDKEPAMDKLFITKKNPSGEPIIELGRNEKGQCPFLESGDVYLCAIHLQVGSDALPAICRLYPRMCVLSPLGVYIGLSHSCPTAAALLFSGEETIAITQNPPTFPPSQKYEGLDARKHLPPLLRPNVLMTWEAYILWEQYIIEFINRKEYTPEDALIVLCTTVEKLRSMNSGEYFDIQVMKEILQSDKNADAEQLKSQIKKIPSGIPHTLRYYTQIINMFDGKHTAFKKIYEDFKLFYSANEKSEILRNFANDYAAYIHPVWSEFERPIRRYITAQLFANYFAYQGNGLRTGIFFVIIAQACVRVHSTILCVCENTTLNKNILLEAIRLTDLLLLHLLPRNTLIQFLNLVEESSLYDMLAPLKD